MKKTLLKILTAVAAVLMPWPLAAVNNIIHTAYYNGNVTIGTDTLGGVTYATVYCDGLYNGGAPGTPSLPVDYIRFSVPYNATNFTVTAQPKNTYSSRLNYPIYPCQEPRMMSDTTPVVITLPDSAAYYSGSDYPTQRAWIVDEGFLAGENHIVTVAVMPIAYKYSATGIYRHTLKESHSVRLTLSYSLSDSLAMYPIVRNDSTLRAEGYALTQRMVANPSNVIANAPIEMTMDSLIFINPNQGDGLNGGGIPPYHPDPGDEIPDTDSTFVNGGELQPANYCPYLIVTTSELKHAVRRIAALKRQKGYNVKVVTMDEVLNSPYSLDGDRIKQDDSTYVTIFTDNAGKLRQYLKYVFQVYGTKYVLLAGNNLPFRTWLGIPTDWYYSDLNADYSQDYNDYVTSFSTDYYADLNIGRLLAKTPEQINNYTDKVLRYELNPGNGDYSYLKKAIATQGRNLEDSFMFFHSLVTRSLPKIFTYVRHIKEQEGQGYPTGKAIIDSINNNYSLICSLNHGSPSGMNVYGHGCDGNVTKHYVWGIDSIRNNSDMETGNGLNNLHNKYYPMIYYSLSCETMPFGYNNGISFGESFTMGKNYGGPIYIGNTTNSINNGNCELMSCFLSNLKNAEYKIGAAYSLSKLGYGGTLLSRIPQCGAIQNLLGDPSIELWTDIPQTYANVEVTREDSTIRISGIDVDSTIVVVRDISSKILYKRMVSTDTVNFNHISPNSAITLYKHNYIPLFLPLALQNIAINKQQYIFASDIVAGELVDTRRASGDVTVKSGAEFEIEAKGTVTLQDGFKVEKGATFAVYPSSF